MVSHLTSFLEHVKLMIYKSHGIEVETQSGPKLTQSIGHLLNYHSSLVLSIHYWIIYILIQKIYFLVPKANLENAGNGYDSDYVSQTYSIIATCNIVTL